MKLIKSYWILAYIIFQKFWLFLIEIEQHLAIIFDKIPFRENPEIASPQIEIGTPRRVSLLNYNLQSSGKRCAQNIFTRSAGTV
jgi:hypothetical protein